MLSRHDKIPNIRILPMDKDEHTKMPKEEVQIEFFIKDLSNREEGEFKYKKRGMDSKKGELVLFQYDNSIIALAILNIVKKFKPQIDEYKGAYYFDTDSIAVFKPIDKNEIKLIWNDFKGFGNAKKNLDPSKYPLLWDLLQTKDIVYAKSYLSNLTSEEVYQREVEIVRPPINLEPDCPKVKPEKSIVNGGVVWPRNTKVASGAIDDANYLCEIDDTHTYFTSQITGENYVEAHHLIPMEYQDKFDCSLDVPANIVALCSVCHDKLHHAVFNEKRVDLEKLYKKRIQRLNMRGIYITLKDLYDFYK